MLYKYVKEEVRVNKAFVSKKKNWGNAVVSFSCLALGISLLLYSFYPYINNYLRKRQTASKILLTPTAYFNSPITKQASTSSTNMVSDYLTNVNKNFNLTNQNLDINNKTLQEYSNIQGEILLSIPSLNLSKLKVKLNVDSFNEKSYLPILERYLGHFKGTSLPDKPGNTFIYGHSANELLAKTAPNTPKLAFSFLGYMGIGDEIILEYNGKEYKYSTQKFNMVSPDDISPIYTNSNDHILTLMTCWPPGIGSERLIVTSKLIN